MANPTALDSACKIGGEVRSTFVVVVATVLVAVIAPVRVLVVVVASLVPVVVVVIRCGVGWSRGACHW